LQWSDVLAGDRYVYANLSLASSKVRNSWTALMQDFGWTERQLALNDVLCLRSDFALLLRAIADNQDAIDGDNSCDGVNEAGILTALDLISGAVQLAWGNTDKNPREHAFQMHGRLSARRSELELIDKYASSVELHAERLWLCSMDPFFRAGRGHLIASPSGGLHVLCVVFLHGMSTF
jgi:hypothetical protein